MTSSRPVAKRAYSSVGKHTKAWIINVQQRAPCCSSVETVLKQCGSYAGKATGGHEVGQREVKYSNRELDKILAGN